MYRVLYALFLLSGAAGLVYQVVWSRLLDEIFGVTVHALTAVLATFLGGLALGGWLLGRAADGRPDPLRLYGWLELGIGVAAVAGTAVVEALEPLHLLLASRLAPDSLLLLGARMALAATVVLPATFLMGGTLPVVARVFVGRLDQVGRELGMLYALNTLGAVAGSLAAGFVLIRRFGLHPTLGLAVAANLAAGAVALALARRRAARPAPPRAAADAPREVAREPGAGAGLLAVMALCGVVTLGLEVLWTRMLILQIGTTTYAFVTVLASFLTGLAAGGLLARAWIDRVHRRRRLFGWLQLGIAASTLATLPLLGGGTFQAWIEGRGADWLLLIALRFGASFLILLVPTILIGMTFPLAAAIWTRDLRALGRDLGRLYGANTLGNVVGAAAAGFVLLPALGLQRGVAALAAASLVNAGWGFLPTADERRGAAGPARAVALAAGAVTCAVLLLAWQPRPFRSWEERDSDETLYYREDAVATVKVLRSAGVADHRWMTVDGIKIGETLGGVDAKQQFLAHLPFLVMPERDPQAVLSIGLGTGVLIGEVARHPSVRSAECVEISPAVIEGAALFGEFNHGALDDPRVHVIADDGVSYLRRSAARYDAIVSDAKSRRAHAGNGVFFSTDYYGLCREHLAPDGTLVQWVPLDLPPAELAIVLRSLLASFPHVYVWLSPPHSGFLVGRLQPLTLDLPHVARVLADPATAGLRRHGWTDAYEVASLLVAGRDTLEARLGPDGPLNSFERPVIEFYSPRDYAVPPWLQRADNLALLAPADVAPPDLRWVGADAARLQRYREAVARLLDAAVLVERGDAGRASDAAALVERALGAAPEHGPVRRAAVGILSRVVATAPPAVSGRTHGLLGSLLEAEGRLREAAESYGQAIDAEPERAAWPHRLGVVSATLGETDTGLALLERAVALAPGEASIHTDLARVLLRAGRFDEALDHFREAARLRPDDPAALDGMAQALIGHPRPERRDPAEAVRLAERAAELTGHRYFPVLATLADAYAAAGRLAPAREAAAAAERAAAASGDTGAAAALGARVRALRETRETTQAPGR